MIEKGAWDDARPCYVHYQGQWWFGYVLSWKKHGDTWWGWVDFHEGRKHHRMTFPASELRAEHDGPGDDHHDEQGDGDARPDA